MNFHFLLFQDFSCDRCKKKFFEKFHLVLHQKHVHLKYPDEATKLNQVTNHLIVVAISLTKIQENKLHF